LNGAPGLPVDARPGKVEVSAKDRRIRGFVSAAAELPEPARELVLQYRLSLDQVTYTLPIDAPAMFYVGLHDTDPSSGDWTALRNALLIQHRRMTAEWEEYFFASQEVEEIWAKFPNLAPTERRLELEKMRRDRRCGVSGVHRVADVWKVAKTYDAELLTFDNIYSGRIASADASASSTMSTKKRLPRAGGSDAISIRTDQVSWSPALHLKQGGSTHNVYLDWYYYESTAALLVFLTFAMAMTGVTFMAAWRMRRSVWGPFALGVGLQVVAILLLMYAQPYVWVKFYWVVFGVASALAIHPETKRLAPGSLAHRSE
jgi:hypothetical protein